ncbi:MAG: aa3-type cytochrome c oxidase subunit IV [Methyloligellaceae bacterium]
MGVDFSSSHHAMDARQHQQTYSAFIKLTIASCIMAALMLAGMAVFLT